MKIIVGVDLEGTGRRAAELALRLKLKPPATLQLVHAVDRVEPMSYGGLPPDAYWMVHLLKEQEEAGERALRECSEKLQFPDAPATTRELRHGEPVRELVAAAQDGGADLIVVGSRELRSWERFVVGSVKRRLIPTSPVSLLLTKPRPLSDRPLKAVLATDHSEYSHRCIDLLMRMFPRGIGELQVVTAYPKNVVDAVRSIVPHFKADVSRWIEDRLHQENAKVVERLSTLPWILSSRVVAMEPIAGITQALDEYDADLLIVGAQGHGLIERLSVGSVSQELATRDPRHTLILRF